MLRKYLESITGIVTGSTQPNDNTVNFAIMTSGLKGEGHKDNDVWFVKSHFPGIAPNFGSVVIKKTVVSVRNPIDVMMSFLNFKLTFSHTKSVGNEFSDEFQKEWLWFIEEMHYMWEKQYTYWRNIEKEDKIPIYYLRYEDLVENPR